MKDKIYFYVFALSALVLSLSTQSFADAGEEKKSKQESTQEKENITSTIPEADSILNEARLNTGDLASAPGLIDGLERMANKFPGYKYRADLYYYLGFNEQTLGEYSKAANAFQTALKIEPAIATETPIISYLRAAKNHTFIRVSNFLLIGLLIITLVPSIWQLTRKDMAGIKWGRIFSLYLIISALYAVIIFLLPVVFGSLKSGLEEFPKPVLSNFHIGQIGDQPLMALLGYGIGAILATLPVVTSASRIKSNVTKNVLTTVGVILVMFSVMGLYGIRHLFLQAKYNNEQNRFVFLSKSIDSMNDVPDVMFPLYEKDFVKRILERRKQEK